MIFHGSSFNTHAFSVRSHWPVALSQGIWALGHKDFLILLERLTVSFGRSQVKPRAWGCVWKVLTTEP